MSYRIDHKEPISKLVSRLREEHQEIGRKLETISKISRKEGGDLRVAVSLLDAIGHVILRHAVEEEARLGQVIMESSETRKKSEPLVRILQEHRRIKEFYDELPYFLDERSERQARDGILEFVNLIVNHHAEEEIEIFPLALEAQSREVVLVQKMPI